MNPLPSVSELMVGINVPHQQASLFLQMNRYSVGGIINSSRPRVPEFTCLDTNKGNLLAEPILLPNKDHKSVDSYEISSSESQNNTSSPNTPRDYRLSLAPEIVSLSPGEKQNNNSPTNAAPVANIHANFVDTRKGGETDFKSRSIPENMDRLTASSFHVGQYDLHPGSPTNAHQVSTNESNWVIRAEHRNYIAPSSPCEVAFDPSRRASFSHYPGSRHSVNSRVYPYLLQPVIWTTSEDHNKTDMIAPKNPHAMLPSQYGSTPPIQFGYTVGQHDGQIYAGMVPVGMSLQPVLMNQFHRPNTENASTNFQAHQTKTQPSKRRTIKRRTRTGCLTCRKRRIKCDERKPHCFNCEKSRKLCLGYERLQSCESHQPNGSGPAQQDLEAQTK